MFLLLLLLFHFSLVFSQDSDFPSFLNSKYSTIINDTNFTTTSKEFGDLNKDGLNDAAIILEPKHLDDSISHDRILLIFLYKNNDTIAVEQNNTFLPKEDEGEMLTHIYPTIDIQKNQLAISINYLRGYVSYTFEFFKNDFNLVYAETSGIMSATGDYTNEHFDFKKLRIKTVTGNIDGNKVRSQISFIKNQKLKKLSDLKETYDW